MQYLEKYEDQMVRCYYCQLCQATCPVYLEDLLETHVARSRLNLIHAAFIEGILPVTDRMKEILDRCLLCTSCTRTCPGGVALDEIFIAARHQIYQGKRRGKVRRYLTHQAMKQRGIKGLMGKLKPLADSMGLSSKDLPEPDPNPFEDRYQDVIPAKGQQRARVAYYVGCATNTLYPETAESVVRVLSRNGIEAVLPEGLVCCGLPALADGDIETAQEMIRANITALADLDVDAVVTDCTSCGMVFRTKAVSMLPDDDPLRSKAEALAEKVWEATDYINRMGLVESPGPLSQAVTYHVPCHAGLMETMAEAPRRLLKEIPQTDLVEMESPNGCCGAGGSFFTEHRDLSERIRSRKLENIKTTGTNTIITQCPSCRYYLSAADESYEVIHPLTLLNRAYEG
jgi:glycolate oxidase iron-sulfur subunit